MPAQAIVEQGQPASAASASIEFERTAIELVIYNDLAAVEEEWRRFECRADCTVFQAFDWLFRWYAHIGLRSGVCPTIVVGRLAHETLFLLPFAITPGAVRRLTFLGSDFCDYNVPLLAANFSKRMPVEDFLRLWRDILARLHGKFDLIDLSKMPELVGAQRNPLLALDVSLNPSGAHATQLPVAWNEFYEARRSSATRRRDRAKRKKLGEFGAVRFVIPQDADHIVRTVETLMMQKSKAFARMGIADIFARPGFREFFLDVATNPRTRALTHVSRLDVGEIAAAINLGLRFRDTYYHVLASYDDGEVARFGPGAAHLRDLLAYAIAEGYQCFDFTIGDERYKQEWSDRSFNLYDHVAAVNARGWPLVLPTLVTRRVVRLIKQDQRLWNAFAWLRSLMGRRQTPEEAPPARKSPSIVPE
jgi:CelD/BcsL family acetyltransferase involved in cellulose biosynthesis